MSVYTYAQTEMYKNFEKDWKEVEQFESKGLPKSALEQVEKIYTKAKKKENHPQIIKSLLYKSKFALTLEEEAQLKVIDRLKAEIDANSFPTKNILESILADLYWQYFQQNRWKFYNRTSTSEKVDADDFRTWDLQTIFEETHTYYQRSLENALLLQQTNLNQFNDILLVQKGSQKYRPTLYDFLAHRALDFYKTDERNLQRPAYKFEINNAQLLSVNEQFIKEPFNYKDSLSQQLHALKLYKNLTLFHLNDSDPEALVDITLNRLDFVKANAVFKDKDAIYFETLRTLYELYKSSGVSTEISYRIGLALHHKAKSYIPSKNEEHRWKNKEALDICEAAVVKFQRSSGTVKCASLIRQILQPSLQITNENFVPINTPSRLLVSYKNTDRLYFKAYHISNKVRKEFDKIYNDSAKIAFIKKLKLARNWQTKLKNEKDYQIHKTEIVVPEFQQGLYLLVGSSDNQLNKDVLYAYSTLNVTDLVLIQNSNYGKHLFQVVNRNTGEPISGAKVEINYRSTGGNGKFSKETLHTNAKGQFEFKVYDYYRDVSFTISDHEDQATFGDFYLNKGYKPKETNRTQSQIFLFTDRSIYRPGQPVHFKGIAVAMKANRSEVISDKKVSVVLKDVNYQEVAKLELKTNEFGSFSGEYILPGTGLTGNFYIEAHGSDNGLFNSAMQGQTSFSVEEYKRPKFETEFKPVTESFRLNDNIQVHGFAKAFAGSTITDAKVVYRVFRTAQYPKWYWYYRPSVSSESQEITQGETTTNADGTFEIVFKALPDLKVSPDTQPTFNYKVVA
ncbi:MAG: alpha-2-macroglobulin, partial [Flavobacteriaceae bacterium]|nr:alpha-2-macroglobulin [Flavobacteriaceae bacterium]